MRIVLFIHVILATLNCEDVIKNESLKNRGALNHRATPQSLDDECFMAQRKQMKMTQFPRCEINYRPDDSVKSDLRWHTLVTHN